MRATSTLPVKTAWLDSVVIAQMGVVNTLNLPTKLKCRIVIGLLIHSECVEFYRFKSAA
jgi:hypothetical protein